LTDGDLVTVGRYQIRVRCRIGRQGSSNRMTDRGPNDFSQPRRRERISNGRKPVDHLAAAKIPLVPGTELMNLPQFPLAISAIPAQAKPDVLGLEVTLSALKLAAPEGTESILVPLVNQFGVMQQQMFDQFQQAMAMMLQMFGTMHREQMEVIRGELDQLHDLTEEFRALRNELALRTQGGEMLAADPSDTVSEIAEALRATIPAAPAPVATGTSGATNNPRSRPEDGRTLANQPPASSVEYSPPLAPKASAPTPRTESFQQPVAAAREKADGPTTPVDPAERDSIAWLHQRIMTLQRERETRWQKIVKLLPGIS
jgi:hypothetical protein